MLAACRMGADCGADSKVYPFFMCYDPNYPNCDKDLNVELAVSTGLSPEKYADAYAQSQIIEASAAKPRFSGDQVAAGEIRALAPDARRQFDEIAGSLQQVHGGQQRRRRRDELARREIQPAAGTRDTRGEFAIRPDDFMPQAGTGCRRSNDPRARSSRRSSAASRPL